MIRENCNGYTNYPTWAAALWMDNDESFDVYMSECVENFDEDITKEEKIIGMAHIIEEEMKYSLEDVNNPMYLDLLTWTIDQVDFHQIAEGIVERFEQF